MIKFIRLFGFIALLIGAVLLGFGRWFASLDRVGHLSLMLLVITIGLWIFRPGKISFGASSALLMAGLLAISVPASAVFSGFSMTAVWSLIPALFFGFALTKTGLGRRIAYFGMKSFPVTYPNLVLVWSIIGIILSLLTPSMTVRVVIVTPIALQAADICQLPLKSKGRSMVLLIAWLMALIPGLGWFSGTLNGPILSGFYAANPELGAISITDWSRVNLLPVAIVSVLSLLGGYLLLKPKEPIHLDRAVFQAEYDKLGPITRPEVITGLILTVSFILFVTAPIHGIPSVAIVLFALFLLSASGIIAPAELSSGISWDLVLFIGTAMGFGAVLTVTGLSDWLSGHLVTALTPLAENPWSFVYGSLIVMFLWRFVDIATFIPTFAIVATIAPEVANRFGISPLVWVPLLCLAMNSFFLSYTNMFALVAEANMGEKGWLPGHLSSFGVVYFLACLIAMLVAIPYWQSFGLFG